MAAFEAKHGMASLAEFNKPTSHTPRALVAYGPDEEDEFAQSTPQPLSAMEKLQASGPADIDEIIAAYKTDNGIVDQPYRIAVHVASPARSRGPRKLPVSTFSRTEEPNP